MDAKRVIESTDLESAENIISLHFTGFRMKVPLKEAIDIPVRKLMNRKNYWQWEE